MVQNEGYTLNSHNIIAWHTRVIESHRWVARDCVNKINKIKQRLPRGGSFSEHLAIESMGGRHTPIPLRFDAHALKTTSFCLRT
jgi:hypothetical protein